MVEFTLPKNSKVHKGKAWNPPFADAAKDRWREYRVYRFDPDTGDNPRLDTYWVNMSECGPMILDALLWIKNNIRGRGGQPRGLELQQRLQAEHLGLVGGEVGQHPGQPDRLVAEVGPHPVVAGGGGVALVEDQVEHAHHVVEPLVRSGPVGSSNGVGRGQGLLRPRDALADRRLLGQEGARDLGGGQAADQPQREGGSGLRATGRGGR